MRMSRIRSCTVNGPMPDHTIPASSGPGPPAIIGVRPQRSTSRRAEVAAVLIAVAAIVAIAHWPVLRAQAQSLDDDSFLTINPLVTRPGWPSTWRFFSEVLHPSSVGGY